MFVTSLNQSLPLHRSLRFGRHTNLLQCKVAMHNMPVCSYTRVTIHSYTRAINQLLRLVYESTWLSASIPLQGINLNPCNKYESSTSKSMLARIIGVNLDVCVCILCVAMYQTVLRIQLSEAWMTTLIFAPKAEWLPPGGNDSHYCFMGWMETQFPV